MDRREERTHPRGCFHHARQSETRDFQLATAPRNLPNAFAHERRAIDRTLASYHEVRFAQMLFQSRVFGKQVKTGREARVQKRKQSKTKSASRARARHLREVLSGFCGHDLRQAPQTFLGVLKILRSQSLLRTVNPRRAFNSKQPVLHVHRDDDRLELCPPRRRTNRRERAQGRPSLKSAAFRIEESPPQSPRQAEAAVVRCAAADSNEAVLRAFPSRRVNHCTQAEGVQLKRMKLSARQHGKTDDFGGFDDCRFAFRFPPPMGDTRAVSGINSFRPLQLRPQRVPDDFAKAIAAIAHREQFQFVARSCPAPTASNGLRSGSRGERAFELIRDNQDFHRRALSSHDAKSAIRNNVAK